MPASKPLDELLRQLRASDSTADKLRTLALEWRSLRQLGRRERAQLALGLGVDGAGRLVERLATRGGGTTPSELLEAVHAARQADPAKLERLLAELRDPDERRELLGEALETLEARLEDELEDASEAVPPEPMPLPPPPPEPADALPPAGPPEPARPDVTSRKEAEAEVHEPAEEPTPAPAAAAPARQQPEPAQPPAAAAGQLPRPAPTPEPPPHPRRHSARRAPAPTAVAPPRTAVEVLVGRIANAPTPAAQLRLVREHAARATGWQADEVSDLLAALPPGWRQRRALAALLAAGAPSATAAALDLVAGLEAERDRVWCLSALVRARALDDEDTERALELVTSPAARRRLARLARRGT